MQFAETEEASHYPTLSQLIQVSKQKTSYSASYLENLNGIYRKKRQTPCRGNRIRFARLQSHTVRS